MSWGGIVNEENNKFKVTIKILTFLYFSAIFVYLTIPISDPDFWWHLASGRWMWDNRSLIHDDPFAIPYDFSESELRKEFILKQYWLSQLVFYGIYSLTGFKGVIFLRALVFTIMFFIMYHLMRKENAGYVVSASLVYLSVAAIVNELGYVGDKPQMWSSLFSVMVVLCLENLREDKKWSYFALPALIFLWSNMHGGFIFGDVIIAVYVIGNLISHSARKAFYIISVVSILISGINPNGFTAFMHGILPFFYADSAQYTKSIVETQSIFQHGTGSAVGVLRKLPHLTGLFLLSLLSFVINIKQIKTWRKEIVFLYILVLIMGLKAIRFIIFFVAIASFITSINLKGFLERVSPLRLFESRINIMKKLGTGLTMLILVVISTKFAIAGIRYTGIFSEKPYNTDYTGAVTFIKQNGLKGNIFNEYNDGGYLIWWLTPDSRVFIDGRNLYLTAFSIFTSVVDSPYSPVSFYDRTPVYERVLDYFNIDLVVLPGCDKVSGTLIKLPLALTNDEKWALVYADSNALVFMRNISANSTFIHRYKLPDIAAYNNILSMAINASRSRHGHFMPNWKLSMAVGYEGRGEKEKALYWINEYLKYVPYDSFAINIKKRIEEIEKY